MARMPRDVSAELGAGLRVIERDAYERVGEAIFSAERCATPRILNE